ncbi:hypothetical protein B0682_05195 [Moraxella lincolnii]|uniref:Uncharacterized protein n=1 Tax=Lwoffella lincolnii TaxID=90241 RepID=A0A1T0CF61_9GAMM|nr:hypothetical protein B0682_05195 [Moraxella lincolnii]
MAFLAAFLYTVPRQAGQLMYGVIGISPLYHVLACLFLDLLFDTCLGKMAKFIIIHQYNGVIVCPFYSAKCS